MDIIYFWLYKGTPIGQSSIIIIIIILIYEGMPDWPNANCMEEINWKIILFSSCSCSLICSHFQVQSQPREIQAKWCKENHFLYYCVFIYFFSLEG